MDKYDGKDLNTLIMAMAKVKADLEIATAEKTRLQVEYDFLRTQKIPEAMDDDGVGNITLKDVGRVSLTNDVYASIPAAQRENAYEWLRANGHGDLIKETVHTSTLKAFAKNTIKEGKELPEDLFKVTPFSRASITK